MFRFLFILLLIVILGLGIAWFSMQSLPSWFDPDSSQEDQVVEQLKQQIDQQGARAFLGNKLQDIVRGKLVMSEPEFNALLLASLEADEGGRQVLSVTDAIRAFIHKDQIEIAAIFNLDKIERVNPKARKTVERFDKLFFFLDGSRVSVSVYGTPVVRNGEIGIKDDFYLKVGAIPITNNTLRQLGVKVERANQESLALKLLRITSIETVENEITMGVRARF